MAKKKKADKKAGKKEVQWPYYSLGDIAIGVSPHPEAEDSYALFVVVGDTGYAVAGYADEEDAREAAQVLEEAMDEASKLHTHGPGCAHEHGEEGEFEIELEDLEDEPKKGAKKGAKKGGKKAAAKKPAAKKGKSKR